MNFSKPLLKWNRHTLPSNDEQGEIRTRGSGLVTGALPLHSHVIRITDQYGDQGDVGMAAMEDTAEKAAFAPVAKRHGIS